MARARKSRSRRPNWALAWAVVIAFAVALFYIIQPALTESFAGATRAGAFDAVEGVQRRALSVFVVGWFFFLGSCFGSFLNVMAWRLPRGRSINGSSHCPFCNQRLAALDNLPVLGWLRLGGRCRTCRLPISPRYLLVELFTGGLFLALFFVEVASGGNNLPQFAGSNWSGISYWVSASWTGDLVAAYALHAIWFTGLITATLIEWDGLFLPVRMHVTLAALAAVVAAFFPAVIPPESLWAGAAAERWAPATSGFVIGSALGLAAAWVYGRAKLPQRDATDPGYAALYAMSGAFLGPRAVVAVALAASAIDLFQTLACRARGASPRPHAASLLAGGFVFISVWRIVWPWATNLSICSAAGVSLALYWTSGRLAVAGEDREQDAAPSHDQPLGPAATTGGRA